MNNYLTTIKSYLRKALLADSYISTFLGASAVLIVFVLIFQYIEKVRIARNITPQAAKTEAGRIPEIPSPLEIAADKSDFPRTYTVKKGEYLWQIANSEYKWGEAWSQIAKANNLRNPNRLTEGQQLTLPKIEVPQQGQILPEAAAIEAIIEDTYKVEKGEDLFTISERAYGDGRHWIKLAKANKLRNPNHVEAGQELIIPRD